MKKMKLTEAISEEAIDASLEQFRKPIESKLRGDIGKYVLSLEMVLDEIAASSTKSDAEFSAIMNKIKRNVSRMAPAGKAAGTKRAATKGPGQPQPTRGEPEAGGDLPSLASLAAGERGDEPVRPPPIKPGARLKRPRDTEPKPDAGEWEDWMKGIDDIEKEAEKEREKKKEPWKPEKLPDTKAKQKKKSASDIDRALRKKTSFWDKMAKKK